MKAAKRGPYLRITSGINRDYLYPLVKDTIVIGRHQDNDIVIADEKISRHHAKLTLIDSVKLYYRLEDLRSKNGVQVNGVPVTQATTVQLGDRIMIANYVEFELENGEYTEDLGRHWDAETLLRPIDDVTSSGIYTPITSVLAPYASSPATVASSPQASSRKVLSKSTVFVSHSSKDDELVNQIQGIMGANKLDLWVDHQRLAYGKDWENEITQALEESAAGLLIVSPKALDSHNCRGERQFFIRKHEQREKHLYVILTEDVELKHLPFNITPIQFIKLGGNMEGRLAPLIRQMKNDLHGELNPELLNMDTLPVNAGKHVFVSHSYHKEDVYLLQKLVYELQSSGLEVWTDLGELEPGSLPWRMDTSNALRQCSSLVALVTPHSDTSRWMQYELEYAEQMNKPMFGVRDSNHTGRLFGTPIKRYFAITDDANSEMDWLIHTLYKYKPNF